MTESGILAFVHPDTNLPNKLTPMEPSGSGNPELVVVVRTLRCRTCVSPENLAPSPKRKVDAGSEGALSQLGWPLGYEKVQTALFTAPFRFSVHINGFGKLTLPAK